MSNWQDYAPAETSRVRETIEWSITYSFNAKDKESPRVLLIGDSIVNAYQNNVRGMLEGKANVTFWASSKCVTDPDYFRELQYILGILPYDVICFNNGLHSLSTDRAEWENAYAGAVRMIRDVCPASKLLLTLCTPLQNTERTETCRRMNAYITALAKREALGVIDLFTPMEAFDRENCWADGVHFRPHVIVRQAEIVTAAALENLDRTGGAEHASTSLGPSGAIR